MLRVCMLAQYLEKYFNELDNHLLVRLLYINQNEIKRTCSNLKVDLDQAVIDIDSEDKITNELEQSFIENIKKFCKYNFKIFKKLNPDICLFLGSF